MSGFLGRGIPLPAGGIKEFVCYASGDVKMLDDESAVDISCLSAVNETITVCKSLVHSDTAPERAGLLVHGCLGAQLNRRED
jgi:hypothetical protein